MMDELLTKINERLKHEFKGWSEETVELIPGVPFRINNKQNLAYIPFPEENTFVQIPMDKLVTDGPCPSWLEKHYRLADIKAILELLPVDSVFITKNEEGKPLVFKFGDKALLIVGITGSYQWDRSSAYFYSEDEMNALNIDFDEFPILLSEKESDLEVIEPGRLLFIKGIDGKPEKLLTDFQRYPVDRHYDYDIDETEGEVSRELKLTVRITSEKLIDLFGHMAVQDLYYDLPIEIPHKLDTEKTRTINTISGIEIIETVRTITSYHKKGPDLKGKTLAEAHSILGKDFGYKWLTTSSYTSLRLLDDPFFLRIDFDDKFEAVLTDIHDTRFSDGDSIDPIRSGIPVSIWFNELMEKIRDNSIAYNIKICRELNEIEVEKDSHVSSYCEI